MSVCAARGASLVAWPRSTHTLNTACVTANEPAGGITKTALNASSHRPQHRHHTPTHTPPPAPRKQSTDPIFPPGGREIVHSDGERSGGRRFRRRASPTTRTWGRGGGGPPAYHDSQCPPGAGGHLHTTPNTPPPPAAPPAPAPAIFPGRADWPPPPPAARLMRVCLPLPQCPGRGGIVAKEAPLDGKGGRGGGVQPAERGVAKRGLQAHAGGGVVGGGERHRTVKT